MNEPKLNPLRLAPAKDAVKTEKKRLEKTSDDVALEIPSGVNDYGMKLVPGDREPNRRVVLCAKDADVCTRDLRPLISALLGISFERFDKLFEICIAPESSLQIKKVQRAVEKRRVVVFGSDLAQKVGIDAEPFEWVLGNNRHTASTMRIAYAPELAELIEMDRSKLKRVRLRKFFRQAVGLEANG